ncbi:MAG TPA: rod shape-determining protein RodA [Actinomycetota bacterium]|nr:rod shape-determining protein RodA [Actinomycetota bacterium]
MDLVAGRVWVPERRPIRHVDGLLLVTMLALATIGLFMVYSATHTSLETLRLDPGTYLKRQVTWVALGTVLMLLTATFDYRFVKVYAGLAYAALLVALALVQTPLGTTVKGSQRWFELAGFQLTPSEFMKIGLIGLLAAVLSELRSKEPSLSDVFRVTVIATIPIVLVFLQPDVGTSMVLAAILVGVLVVAGARARHLGVLALAAIVLLLGAFQLGVVRDYQITRLTAVFDPENAPEWATYNREQAEIAVGSGGVLGRGYLKGPQTNLDYVPEQHTDFVFTVVGEEFGFVGSMMVLLLFGVLLWRGVRIALLSKDPFGAYVAAGVVSMLAIQVFVNVGMVIGIMPITGIPLPFVSYGGSSFLANSLAVGLLLNVHMRRFK